MKKAKPKVAIAVAIYNGEMWLKEQLASLLDQESVSVTLFISVEPSSDKSCEIVRDAAKYNNNIVVLSDLPSSGSAAMNFIRIIREIDLHEFDFLSFSDQDDIWLFDKLASATLLMNDASADAYSSNLFAFDDNKSFLVKKDFPFRELDYLFQGASAGCTYVLRKELAIFVKNKIIVNFDSLPERPSHDWLIYAISRSYGYKWVLDDRAFMFYRQHDNNVRGAVHSMADYYKRLKLSRTGWYRQHVLSLLPFLKQTPDEMKVIDHLNKNRVVDRIWLAINVSKYRRRLKERFFLFIVIIVGSL